MTTGVDLLRKFQANTDPQMRSFSDNELLELAQVMEQVEQGNSAELVGTLGGSSTGIFPKRS